MENNKSFKYTVGILGGNKELTKQIKCELKDSPISPSHRVLELTFPIQKKYQNENINIIILNLVSFRCSLDNILNPINNIFPRAGVILIMFSENYHLAVSSFRKGIRDVLIYPWDTSEFYQSLLRTLNHQYLIQKSKSTSKLMELMVFFGDGHKYSRLTKLLTNIEKKLRSDIRVSGFSVLRIPAKKVDLFNLSLWSGFWNNKLFKEMVMNNDLRHWLQNIYHRNLKFSNIYFDAENKRYNIFSLGLLFNYFYIIIFISPKKHISLFEEYPISSFNHLFKTSLKQLGIHLKQEKLSKLIHLDDLTGLYNQRKMKEDLKMFISKKRDFTVFFVDVDKFKQINDTYGHMVGGFILAELGPELKRLIRETDYVYRYGGDEFVIIIPDCCLEESIKLGGRVLIGLKKRSFVIPGKAQKKIFLTVSIGVANYPSDVKYKEDILQLADEMMYHAKEKGRNRVFHTGLLNKSIESKEV